MVRPCLQLLTHGFLFLFFFGYIALKIWTILIWNSCILFNYLVRLLIFFLLISYGGASQVQLFFFFFFVMSQYDWLIAKKTKTKTLKLWRLPKNRRFYRKMECLLLWPSYIGEKGRTLGKTYRIKDRLYWEHIGNLRKILRS